MAHFDVKELEKRKKEDLQKLANELGSVSYTHLTLPTT